MNFVVAFVPDMKKGCQKFEMMTMCLDLLNPKSIGLVENCYCAKFQVIPNRQFHSIVLTHTHTHTHTPTQRDKVNAVSEANGDGGAIKDGGPVKSLPPTNLHPKSFYRRNATSVAHPTVSKH